MPINTIHLPTGRAVVITATSAAIYYQTPAGTPTTAISAGADSSLIGPFGTPRDYSIDSEKPATYTYSTPDPFAAGDSLDGVVLTDAVLITPDLGVATSTSIDGVSFSSGAGAPDSAVQASLIVDPAGANNALAYTSVAYGTGGNDITIAYVAPTIATLNVNPAGDENALDFTAVDFGPTGNDVTIEYVDPGDINQTISVDVTESAIVVSLATEGAGTITTTAAELITAFELVSAATDLAAVAIDASDTGGVDDGSGVVTAMAEASLTGGLGLGPAQSTEATVVVVGTDCVVHLETDASAVVACLASEVITAWEAHAPAVALATVALSGGDSGATDVTAVAEAPLANGVGTGIGTSPKGEIYVDLTNAKLYVQGGTLAVPVWNIVTSA